VTVQQFSYGKPEEWQEIQEEGTAGGRLVGIGQGLLHRLRNLHLSEEFVVGEWRGFQVVLTSANLQARVLLRAPTGEVIWLDLQPGTFFFMAARLRDLDAQHAQLAASIQTLRMRLENLGTPPGPWSRGDEAHALLTDYRQLCEDLSTDGSADEIAFTFDRERPVPTPKPRTEDDADSNPRAAEPDGDSAVEPDADGHPTTHAVIARDYDVRDDGDDADDISF
jgi:hypothetical protein